IHDMVVTKAYRSKGVGSRLMSAVKEYAKANGAEFLRTQVFPQNEDGMRFYEKNGFSLKMLTIECPL
ncbi:MAG: GNAT family N-acetyltransferase, partial [Ruminococcus sp.]|nr:GNAT family N-acetyltransferase [Ruminococcus sp.]